MIGQRLVGQHGDPQLQPRGRRSQFTDIAHRLTGGGQRRIRQGAGVVQAVPEEGR